MSAETVVQRQLDAYNAQNLEAFCVCFADDCVIADLNGAVSGQGADAVRARYAKLFAEFPQNRAELLNRIVVGDVVIDHEDIARTPDGARFRAAAIYTVRDGMIARVDFLREQQ
jgi:uncharacterized protein (TIGR02246 family)